jgi:hypothetical protein
MPRFLTRANRYDAGTARIFIVSGVGPAAFFEPDRSFADIVCCRRGKIARVRRVARIHSVFHSPPRLRGSVVTRAGANRYGAGTASIVVACCVGPAAFFEPDKSFADIVCCCRGKIARVARNPRINSAFLSPPF